VVLKNNYSRSSRATKILTPLYIMGKLTASICVSVTDLPCVRPQNDTFIYSRMYGILTRWVIGPYNNNPTLAGNYLSCVDFGNPIEECSWRLMNPDGSNYSPKIEITDGLTYSLEPTVLPSKTPTRFPTSPPTKLPTSMPSPTPTTPSPTRNPTPLPTNYCESLPIDSCFGNGCEVWSVPNSDEIICMTAQPTSSPTTPSPTKLPTHYPSQAPTNFPTTGSPTSRPTRFPSLSPTTPAPTFSPTRAPTTFCSTLNSVACDEYPSCLWYGTYCEQTLPPTAAPTMQSVLDKIETWVAQLNKGIFSGIMLGFGPILCMFGQKLFKFIVFIIGFCIIGWFSLELFANNDTGFRGYRRFVC